MDDQIYIPGGTSTGDIEKDIKNAMQGDRQSEPRGVRLPEGAHIPTSTAIATPDVRTTDPLVVAFNPAYSWALDWRIWRRSDHGQLMSLLGKGAVPVQGLPALGDQFSSPANGAKVWQNGRNLEGRPLNDNEAFDAKFGFYRDLMLLGMGGMVGEGAGAMSEGLEGLELSGSSEPTLLLPEAAGAESVGGVGVEVGVEGSVADGGLSNVRALGIAGEEAVGVGAKTRIPSLTGTAKYRIPDQLTSTTLVEVKNVGHLSLTRQLTDFHLFSQQTGRQFLLYTRTNTTFSGPLQNLINNESIITKPIPFR